MPKSDLALLSPDYSPVAERIALFYERFPTGRITTRLISRTERETIFRAAVYRSLDELVPAATGWAAEREGDGEINTNACLENTETSAIGRALANLGFAAVPLRSRPGPLASHVATPPSERSARPSVVTRSPTAVRSSSSSGSSLQARADAAGDLLALIRSAERAGLGEARAELLRRFAISPDASAARQERLARVLRRLIARRVAEDLGKPPSSAGPR